MNPKIFYQRDLVLILLRFATVYPIVGIIGPRQSGKTTLARALFTNLAYVSLEDLDIHLRAEQDPRAFLAAYRQGAIFDEVQHVPQLLSYLQGVVDDYPEEKGRYVLSGSQNFALNHHISQSLSGRIGLATLLPLSLNELKATKAIDETDQSYVLSLIFKGGYPALQQRGMDPLIFYPSYIQTYLERDVRQLKNIENLGKFQFFLKLCAGRVGQIINLSSLAQDAGVSHTTVRHWLTVLEASYIIFLLQPFHKNFSKRLIKMPKLYFYDTGLACTLLGLEKSLQLDSHYLKGGLFENLVILEILKKRIHQGLPPHLYFWRDQADHEIDLIVEWGGTVHAIEVKWGSTLQSDYVKNLKYFKKIEKEDMEKQNQERFQKVKKENSFSTSSSIQTHLVYMGSHTGLYQDVSLIPFLDLQNTPPL